MIVKIEGPDAEQALAEMLSNVQYDDLNVTVTRMDHLSAEVAKLRNDMNEVLTKLLDKRKSL